MCGDGSGPTVCFGGGNGFVKDLILEWIAWICGYFVGQHENNVLLRNAILPNKFVNC